MTENGKLRIKEIRVEGFRGVNSFVTMSCAKPATLLVAPNGRGKTSLLGAIEWCLFGKLNYQPKENLTNDELVNLHHPRGQAKVEVVLVDGAGEVVVSRERKVRKRETILRLTDASGRKTEAKEAEAQLFQLIGLTWEDFSRAVFLHQESIRGLLTDDPEDRDAALDRLFGLEKLRNVSAAIPMKVVMGAVEEVKRKTERATDRLEGAADQLEEQRAKHLSDAKDLGFTEKELTFDNGKKLANDLRGDLENAAKENAFKLPPTEPVDDVDALERLARRAKEATKQIRLGVAKSSPASETTDRLNGLDLCGKALEGALEAEGESKRALRDHEKEWGDAERITKKSQEQRAQMEALQEKLQGLDARDRVVSAAVEYLEATPHLKNCPVCAQGIDPHRVFRNLKQKVQTGTAKEIQHLQDEIAAAQEDVENLKEAARDDARLRKDLQTATKAVGKALQKLQVVLPEASDLANANPVLEKERERLHKHLERLSKVHERREAALQAIDDQVDRLRGLHKFLKTEAKFETLSEKKADEAEEDDPLQKELQGLLGLQDSLQAISTAITEVAKGLATTAVEGSRESIAAYYRRLCNHPYFDGLRIQTEEKNIRGALRNTYTISTVATRDGKESLASSRLSTGQMNCVALSIYLALTNVLTHRLGFIILDDPSQNLDADHKVALARLLKELQTSTQLLIATQDTEMQEILQREFPAPDSTHYQLNWHPTNGTSLAVV